MSELICPDCGHDLEVHSPFGCLHSKDCSDIFPVIDCKCLTRDLVALRAAQRAAAIAYLRSFVESETWVSTKGVRMPAPGTKLFREFMCSIRQLVFAYRAIGVLPMKERKP